MTNNTMITVSGLMVDFDTNLETAHTVIAKIKALATSYAGLLSRPRNAWATVCTMARPVSSM